MSFLGDIVDDVVSLPKKASRAITGKKGVFGSQGVAGNLLRGNIRGAVKAGGHAISTVASSHLLQASFGNVAIPAAVLAGAVEHGPEGALAAVKNAADNPVTKAELAALAVIIPPLAPASAGIVAAMEATSRLVDGLHSKDPKKVAQAAMSIGATALKANEGDPGAKRALDLIRDTEQARNLVAGGNDGHALERIIMAAGKGGGSAKAAAKLGAAILSHQKLRHAIRVSEGQVPAHPAARAASRAVIAKAQRKAPELLAKTMAALKSPKGVRIGDFSLLKTGRVLYHGHPVRSSKARALLARVPAHTHHGNKSGTKPHKPRARAKGKR